MRKDYNKLLPYLTESEKELLSHLLTTERKWEPATGNLPQTKAYESEADILLYGGKPYGGKSDLQLGLARNKHTNSLLLRRTFPELKRGFIPRSLEFFGERKDYNASSCVWSVDGKRIEFGYAEREDDFLRYKGPSFDLIGLDEASETKRFEDGSTPIDLLMPWNRTTTPGQRVRMVITTNPGGPGEEWLIDWFRPWLDTKYHNPAKFGEIRYVTRSRGGKIVEVPKGAKGAKSISFIPSSWKDNPYADNEEYEKGLNLLPEPLRSQLKLGLWGSAQSDDRWQVIPSQWVRDAQARWKDRDKEKIIYDAVGVDIAYGGKDKTVFARKKDNWFSELSMYDGKSTPDGQAAAGLLEDFLGDGTPSVCIDSIGYGASCYDFAKEFCDASAFIASQGSEKLDRNGRLGFSNKRAEVWWKFREALDPSSGENIALPKDQTLLSDLCSARWKLMSGAKIQIEPKTDIIRRIGRSPDTADAVIMCWYAGGSVHISDFYPEDKRKSIMVDALTEQY